MADDLVIRAEGLGKKYVIGHEAQHERYLALRDVIARGARNAWRMAADMAKGRVVVPGDEVEEFWALKDVSFEVKRGEVLGIVGRNGAGKSTLLKILSRITEPTEGRVTIKGRVASLLEVGTGFHPELTGRENIYLNGAILGMTRAEIKRKFDEIVAFAEIEKFLDTPVKRYSSGMYVRLAFAVAAHLEPEILIVDEVLAVGDAEFQKKCLGKMSEVAMGGRTILFVSHNMAAVQNLCRRTIVLDSGKVVNDASPAAAIPSYLAQAIFYSNDLANRPRPGWARQWIRGARLLDSGGVERNSFALGEEITVEMSFAASAATALPVPGMGVVINHLLRGTVGGINTRMTNQKPKVKSCTAGTFRATIEVPLLQGSYSIDLWLDDGRSDVDVVEDACRFSVEGSDIYGSGQTPYADLGVVFMRCNWEFIQEPSTTAALGAHSFMDH